VQHYNVGRWALAIQHSNLIYDWNRLPGASFKPAGRVLLTDESLRDGLQSPSVKDPKIEEKIEILHLMEALGIDYLDLGLPGAGPRAVADVECLAREIVNRKLKIKANCAARTHENDIRPVAEISQRVGIPIEACTFIGSSPIRQFAEDHASKGRLPLVATGNDFRETARSLNERQTGLVKAILGEPTEDAGLGQPLNPLVQRVLTWRNGNNYIMVTLRNGKVAGKMTQFINVKRGK